MFSDLYVPQAKLALFEMYLVFSISFYFYLFKFFYQSELLIFVYIILEPNKKRFSATKTARNSFQKQNNLTLIILHTNLINYNLN